MRAVAHSILLALADAVQPRMLWLMLWPVLVALAIWGVVALVFWGQFVLWLADLLFAWLQYGRFLLSWNAVDVARIAAKIVTLLALAPLVQLTALFILGVFGMPAMVEHVAQRRYPGLEKRRGGGFVGSLWNSLLALAGLVALALVSLPLWVFPPLWPLIPVAITGWVNQRVLRYDALAEHAARDEMRQVFAGRRATLYALGVVLALLAYVPFVGFFAPVLFGLSFIHYLLAALKVHRESPIEGRVL